MMISKLPYKEIFLFIFLALLLGFARQFAPNGIDWKGKWPDKNTSAKEAYAMLAEQGDPHFVSLDEVVAHQKNKTATILDARKPDDFKAGRIPGSRNLPFYQMDDYWDLAMKDLYSDSLIIIYCEGIGCELSFFLGRELQGNGYKNVGIFYGGYPEWLKAGYPVEK